MTFINRIQNIMLRTVSVSLLIRASVVPLAIHLVLWWFLYLVTIIRVEYFGYDASQISLSYWSWLWLAAFMTAFINIIVTFKKDFEYQLIMSVPRHVFAWGYLQTVLIYNLLIAALILLDLNILRCLNHAYGFLEIDFLSAVYGVQTAHPVSQLAVVFCVLMMISSLGAFVGSSTYRFGLAFIWGFWVTVGLGSTMLVVLSGALGYFQELLDALLRFSGGGFHGGPFAGAGHFLVASILLMFIVYLNIKKLQLK